MAIGVLLERTSLMICCWRVHTKLRACYSGAVNEKSDPFVHCDKAIFFSIFFSQSHLWTFTRMSLLKKSQTPDDTYLKKEQCEITVTIILNRNKYLASTKDYLCEAHSRQRQRRRDHDICIGRRRERERGLCVRRKRTNTNKRKEKGKKKIRYVGRQQRL